MRVTGVWIRTMLATVVATALAGLAGMVVALALSVLLGVGLYFVLYIYGWFLGIIAAGVGGGVAFGLLLGRAQAAIAAVPPENRRAWVRRSAWAGVLPGLSGFWLGGRLEVRDASPLIWLILGGALLALLIHALAGWRELAAPLRWLSASLVGILGGSLLVGALVGTVWGRGPVATIRAALNSSPPVENIRTTELIDLNGDLVFVVVKQHLTNQYTWELWRSVPDGQATLTASGFMGMGSDLSQPVLLDGALYFIAHGVDETRREYNGTRYRLWRSDGTPEGTMPLAQLDVIQSQRPVVANDRIFFFDSKDRQCALWVSNGTIDGTVPVFEPQGGCPRPITPVAGGVAFFTVELGSDDWECILWHSDGTRAGTRPLMEFSPDENPDCRSGLRQVGERVVVSNIPGFIIFSDGTPEGTQMLPLEALSAGRPAPPTSESIGDIIFFEEPGNGCRTWLSDGTPQGTALFSEICLIVPLRAGGQLLSADWDRDGWVLNRMEAGDGGLVVGEQIAQGAGTRRQVIEFPSGTSYFGVHKDADLWGHRSCTLWGTDGTPEGTRPVAELCVEEVLPREDAIYFLVRDVSYRVELWGADPGWEAPKMLWSLPE